MRLKLLNCLFLLSLLTLNILCAKDSTENHPRNDGTLIISPQYNDIITVGTVSGDVYIIEGNTGEIQWSFNSGPQLINSSLKSIIPSTYGSIYLFTNEGLQKYPMSITDIVAYSPFTLGDGINFLGTKNSVLFSADLVTKKATKFGEINLDEVSHNVDKATPMKMSVGRADHIIRAVDEVTGVEIWNITVGEYVSSMHGVNSNICKDTYVLVSSMNGKLKMVNIDTGEVKWKIQLNSPALHVGGHTCLQKSNSNIKGIIFQEQLPLHGSDSKVMVSDFNGKSLAFERSFLTNLISSKMLEANMPIIPDPSNGLTIIGEKNIDWKYLECPSGIHNTVSHSIPDSTHLFNGSLLPDRLLDYRNNVDLSIGQFINEIISIIPLHILLFALLLSITVIIGTYKLSEDILNILFGKTKNQESVPNLTRELNQIDENGVLRIGKLEVLTEKILGYGSSGTVVFEGSMNGRKAAVKRMLSQFYHLAERETKLLIESDEHPNVIRYYATEEDQDFVYLALSFADRSINDLVESEEYQNYSFDDKLKILHQLVIGVEHLHNLKIVHRDIKPQNVLIDNKGNVKISDMGLAKKLANDNSSTTLSKGTVGWQAPEIILQRDTIEAENRDRKSSSSSGGNSQRVKVTKKVDIFSLGCLFYYILTGNHPFGDRYSREYNIIYNKFELKDLNYETQYLISRMIDHDPEERYTIEEVKSFPLFWSASKKLQFLKDASDLLEFEKPSSELVLHFEYKAACERVIHNNDWMALMHENLLVDLHKFRKYNKKKLRDLLRVIRNKAHHYRDLDPVLQEVFGSIPEGYMNYFTAKFPKMFLMTYMFMMEECSDKLSSDYFAKDVEAKYQSKEGLLELGDPNVLDCPPGFEAFW